MPIRILIADDHAMVRQGLKMILEAQSDMVVVGEAGEGREALVQAKALKPDVIIMDIAMPELNGIEATRMICDCLPTVRVIILTMHQTNEHVYRAMQAGARAYLLKESAGFTIIDAVRAVMRGRLYFGEGIEAPNKLKSGSHIPSQSPLDSLSRRERETLQLVAEGTSNAAIAEILHISPKSVETYRSRLMLKLGVSTVPDLVKFAIQHGIISLQ
ncbi:MAG: response regulator transcription factor [Desulfuromonadaceae bacterium]|nr:response regulator transcription factor [Desulfuromonadaceae bacterium]MDD2847259.1 response regulator transcription factor [Desulfuromonadaceae bacterium]MDD4130203.1 response regulator transcription factor [Desulfuromonadaceae bacterium]